MNKVLLLAMLAGCAILEALAIVRDPRKDQPTAWLVSKRVQVNSESDVVLGEWNSNGNVCYAYAQKHKVPLIAVWSNGDGCPHCSKFECNVNYDPFRDWMKESGCVFCFAHSGDATADGPIGSAYFHWCRMNTGTSYPFVRVYWPDGGVDGFTDGDTVDGSEGVYDGSDVDRWNPPKSFILKGDVGTFNPGSRRCAYFFTNGVNGVLRNWKPKLTPDYAGGEFGAGNAKETPNAGLAVERGTSITSLFIPFTRTNLVSQTLAATNTFIAYYPDGSNTGVKEIVWNPSETFHEVEIPISAGLLNPTDRADIMLLIGDENRTPLATNYVVIVDKVANSAANPNWIGAPIKAGEWTVDLDAATNAVRDYNAASHTDRAYTLLLFSGSMWCPDCMRTDEFLLDKPEFKAWTTDEKQVACVSMDKPPSGFVAPCILTHDILIGKSGSGWLSRHGVPMTGHGDANATAVLNRVLDGTSRDTQHGGYLLPGTTGMGVPTFVLLRDDGSVAGRISRLAVDSTMLTNNIPVSVLVKRLDELLAQVDEAGEEANDRIATLSPDSKISGRNKTGVPATVSFADPIDYYRIDAPQGTDLTLTLAGEEAAELILSIVDTSSGAERPVAVATNLLTSGISVHCKLPSASCYASVSYPVNATAPDKGFPPKGSYFALDKDGSTLCHYRLKSDSVFSAVQTWTEQTITDGVPEVMISLIPGAEYKFSGLDPRIGTEALDQLVYQPSKGTYVAMVDLATLKLDETSGTLKFGFQHWVPGRIGFVNSSWTVKEKGDDPEKDSYLYDIGIQRTDGVSGELAAWIFLDTNDVRMVHTLTDGETFDWAQDFTRFAWGDGSNDTRFAQVTIKANKNADGPQTLVFKLADESKKVLDEFVLTISDEDEAYSGLLALERTGGESGVAGTAIPASRTVVAKGGSTLRLTVARKEATDGFIGGDILTNGVSAGVGELLSWPGRDGSDRSVEIELPQYVSGGANRLSVTLVGREGSKIVATAKNLTVRIVPETAAEFTADRAVFNGVRYVQSVLSWLTVKVEGGDFERRDLSVSKISGSAAPGVIVEFDKTDGCLYAWGIPTQAGDYTAVYQVSEEGVAGGTVRVDFHVDDPASPQGDLPAVNPHLDTARTISDILVIDGDRLGGLLTVTIPRSGRVSAKYRPFEGEPVSLMTYAWAGCVGGNYTALLATTNGVVDAVSTNVLTVVAKADGGIDLRFWEGEDELTCCLPNADWSASNPATSWAGYYTVSLPCKKEPQEQKARAFACGAGYVTLRMTAQTAVNGGKVTYAGALPNGKGFSGLGVLDDCGGGDARLVILLRSETDSLSAILRLNNVADPDGYRAVYPMDGVWPFWRHDEALAEACYDQRLDVFGCKYDANFDLAAGCRAALKTDRPVFFSEPDTMPLCNEFRLGAANAWLTNKTAMVVSSTDIRLQDATAARTANGLTFSYNRSTGIVVGVLNLDFMGTGPRTAIYRGVVMPGWGTDCEGTCVYTEGVKRPFVSGACWFDDGFKYQDAGLNDRYLPIVRGCEISIGVTPGK